MANQKRQKQDRDPLTNTRKKRKLNASKDRPTFSGPAHPKEHKVNPLKSRIRDLKRLLAKVENIPADVRQAHERELAHLQRDLVVEQEEVRRADQKKAMFATYQKYKMVRFFDRQKAERRLKKATKSYQSAEDPADKERLAHEKHIAEVDLNYAIYYPLAKPYCSLYPSNKKAGEKDKEGDKSASEPKGDLEIWYQIEQTMEAGKSALDKYRKTLPGVQQTKGVAKKSQPQAEQRAQPSRDQRSQTKAESASGGEEEDAEDGIGFFETA